MLRAMRGRSERRDVARCDATRRSSAWSDFPFLSLPLPLCLLPSVTAAVEIRQTRESGRN